MTNDEGSRQLTQCHTNDSASGDNENMASCGAVAWRWKVIISLEPPSWILDARAFYAPKKVSIPVGSGTGGLAEEAEIKMTISTTDDFFLDD
ncbi:hypothetical protein V494_04620 [Pseudogymnoascus sp. VKM F-4513 (FW-928)]|nr:hypothetical protein V494_04620 [Pseudogymnoascus sp. VKM F-4513 (FW-928)]